MSYADDRRFDECMRDADASIVNNEEEEGIVDIPAELVTRLRAARNVVVFTGAGVSAESGIPTFRERQTGLWERFSAEELATPSAFERDPALVWGWYEWRRAKVLSAQPNPAHLAIAAMEKHVPHLTLVTQNVDDLHERAGSHNVLHLHGSIARPYCQQCRQPLNDLGSLPSPTADTQKIEPPSCTHCGGRIRPGVVWFGESLPTREWEAANAAAQSCNFFFCVGTSAVVYPAAGLTLTAHSSGATTVQVNPNATDLDGEVSFNLKGAAGVILPALVQKVWASGVPQPAI